MKKLGILVLSVALVFGMSAGVMAEHASDEVDVEITVGEHAELAFASDEPVMSVDLDEPTDGNEEFSNTVEFTVETNTDVIVYVDDPYPTLYDDDDNEVDFSQDQLHGKVQLYYEDDPPGDHFYPDDPDEDQNAPDISDLWFTWDYFDAGTSTTAYAAVLGNWYDEEDDQTDNPWYEVLAGTYFATVDIVVEGY